MGPVSRGGISAVNDVAAVLYGLHDRLMEHATDILELTSTGRVLSASFKWGDFMVEEHLVLLVVGIRNHGAEDGMEGYERLEEKAAMACVSEI